MAYYDQFTKKTRSKRDDWRDDEMTQRPARDRQFGVSDAREGRPGGRGQDERRYENRRPYSDKPQGDRRPYGDRPQSERRFDERRPQGDRPQRDDRRPYGDRPQSERRFDERRPQGDRPQRDERRPYGDRPQSERRFDERRPHHDRPPRDDRPPRPAPATQPMDEPVRENLLVGRNPIREALRSGRDIEKLLVARGELIGSAREIVAQAREMHVIVQEVERTRLDAIAPNHQGLIAVASAYTYSTVEDMLALAKERGEDPFLVILDGVTDPHNLGAIIRSAECAGAHGVIIPERRAVGLTPAAVKASAGAVEHIPVARETNLTRTIQRLKKDGVWVYGAAMEGEDFRKVDFSGPAALVIGSEGEGISRLVAEQCDKLVGLPMRGKIGSLNASVAAGVLLYAVMGARDGQ